MATTNIATFLTGLTSNLLINPNYVGTVSDTATNVVANLSLLNLDAGNIASINTTNGVVSVSTGMLTSDSAALNKIVGGYNVSDTASNIAANASALTNSAVKTVTATGGPVTTNAASFVTNKAGLDKITGGFKVSDTAANLTSSLSQLGADNNVVSVSSSNGPLTVSVAAFKANQAGLGKLTSSFIVADTGANIGSNIDALNADSQLLSITDTDNAPVAVTATQAVNDTVAFAKLDNADLSSYQLAVTDTAANITANLTGLQAIQATLSSITSTDHPPSVTVATFDADQAALDKVVGGFQIADVSQNLVAAIVAMAADNHITSVISTDGPAVLSVAAFHQYQALADKGLGGFVVSDSTAAIEGALATLVTDPHINSIIASGAPVSVDTPTFTADKVALDKVVGGFAVSDTAAAIQTALQALGADSNITTITATDSPVAVLASVAATSTAVLGKIVGGYTVADTGAAIVAALPALAADPNITAIKASSPVAVTDAVFEANKAALDKVSGGFTVTDTAANIAADLDHLAGDSNIAAIASTTGRVNVVASSFNADQAAVNKLGDNYAISGFRPGITLDLSSTPFKSSYEVVYTVNTGVTDIIDTAASNAVVKELHFITDATASDSGVLVTIAPDSASGTSLGLVPNAAAQLFPGDVVVTDIAGKAYSSIAMHYLDGAFTGENRFYYTNTGNAYTSYVAASNGIEQFSVSGGQGMQQIVGTQDYNAITTANAAGTGMVAVDLAGGTVSKGATQLASLKNVQIVQLGSDASVLKGLASNFDLLYGGSGADTFVGQGANDYIQGGTAANQVLGGTGNEVFYGNGGTDSMTGGSGANFMQGGAASTSNDMFYGTTGNDFIYSQAGTTTVHAGHGTTYFGAGSGTNTLYGNTDVAALTAMQGGTGVDVDYGGIGSNLLYEGSGSDTFVGSSGFDEIFGGSGSSNVTGGRGTTVVTTGAGNQHLTSGSGATYFNETATNQTAGRFDQIDNFQGMNSAGTQGTSIYLAGSTAGATTFQAVSGGTAIVTSVAGGQSQIFVSNASVSAVQANTHFSL